MVPSTKARGTGNAQPAAKGETSDQTIQ